MEQIPKCVLKYMITFLCHEHMCVLARVSKFFNEIIWAIWPNKARDIAERPLQLFRRANGIKHINSTVNVRGKSALYLLNYMPRVTELKISGYYKFEEHFKYITSLDFSKNHELLDIDYRYTPQLKSLNFSKSNFNRTYLIPASITDLDISHCDLASFNGGHLTALRKLNISFNCNKKYVNTSALLTGLYLNDNELVSADMGPATECHLNISDNRNLESIEYRDCKFQYLNISLTKISVLPANVGYLKSYYSYASIDAALLLSGLKSLDFEPLPLLPKRACKLPGLEFVTGARVIFRCCSRLSLGHKRFAESAADFFKIDFQENSDIYILAGYTDDFVANTTIVGFQEFVKKRYATL